MRRPKLTEFIPKISLPRLRKTGLPPGSLIYTGDKKQNEPSITIINYNADTLDENTYSGTDDFMGAVDPNRTTWVNINGLHDVSVIEKTGAVYNLHNLIMEDVLNVYQLPKVDEYHEDNIVFITFNDFYFDEAKQLQHDQISLVIGTHFLITYQEEEGEYFRQVKERLRKTGSRMRIRGTDYLAYALIDAVTDSYFVILDNYAEKLEKVENAIFTDKNKNHLEQIHSMNMDLIHMRKSIFPLKEVVFRLIKDDIILFDPESKLFLRDLHDHVAQVLSQIDVDREYLSDLIQSNMANMNAHLNEIIRILTVISTIFIPLTFIVGVYGMNFDRIPELHWSDGYGYVWGLMILITVILLLIFRKKKWI
ncbi:MAG: magnesium/cobalt transporter CorA [Chitinophagales bacterium]